jgi:hypothetical protein
MNHLNIKNELSELKREREREMKHTSEAIPSQIRCRTPHYLHRLHIRSALFTKQKSPKLTGRTLNEKRKFLLRRPSSLGVAAISILVGRPALVAAESWTMWSSLLHPQLYEREEARERETEGRREWLGNAPAGRLQAFRAPTPARPRLAPATVRRAPHDRPCLRPPRCHRASRARAASLPQYRPPFLTRTAGALLLH